MTLGQTPKQIEALQVYREQGENATKAARVLGMKPRAAQDLIKRALKWEAADPGLKAAMASTGLGVETVTGGWRIVQETMPDGTIIRNSVRYSVKDQKVDSEDLAEAIKEALKDVPKMVVIDPPKNQKPKDLCTFIPLSDLHVGGEYGDPKYFEVVMETIGELIQALPEAKKAVLIDMGDLLDANDHHGLTPASGNDCDVIRENHLKNTLDALAIMKYASLRLLQTHEEVEVHFLRGNHDETAYIAVMIALDAHFRDNNRINVVVTDDDFRVIEWGKCAVFPHHGDKCKWETLKDIFADQFPDAWARAKHFRFVWTAHVHHDKQREVQGAVCEHFRTLAAPNRWARLKGLFGRGGLQAVTLHKQLGEVARTKRNLVPLLLQDKK